MSYGILITNPEGKILIDGERKMPKLYHHGRYYLSDMIVLGDYGIDDDRAYYHDVGFPPTRNPVFITCAVDETVTYPQVPLSYRLRNIYICKNASGEFCGARLEAKARIYVFVWVYEI